MDRSSQDESLNSKTSVDGIGTLTCRINKLHAHIQELEKKGERVPKSLSTRHRASSIIIAPKSTTQSVIAEEGGSEEPGVVNPKLKATKPDVETGPSNGEDKAIPQ